MKSALLVATHEFKTMYRRRIFQLITVGLPAVALGGLLVIWFVQNVLQDEEVEQTKAGYVDGSGLLTGHRAQTGVEFVAYETRENGMQAMLAEDVARLYVIPQRYLDTGQVQRFEVGSLLNLDNGRDRELRAFLLDNLSESAPHSDVIERLKEPLVLTVVAVDSEGLPRHLNQPRVFFFMGLALTFMLSLAMTGGFLLQGLGEEKENRIMEVLLSSVTPGQLMIGKVLGLGGAGLSQILLWVVSGRIILAIAPAALTSPELELPGLGPSLLAVAFFVLGYLLFATLNAGIGAVAPTARESQQLSVLVAAPLVVPIYAWIYIVENPTAGVVKFLTFFPFTAPLVVLQRLGPDTIESWEVAASLVVLGLAVAGAMFLVGRIFRAFLLSYGKRPSVRLVWAALVRG